MEVDRELVEAAQAGDRWAPRSWCAERTAACTPARSGWSAPDDAADVTQDVYLRVVRKLGGFGTASFSHLAEPGDDERGHEHLEAAGAAVRGRGGGARRHPRPGAEPSERAEAAALARRLELLVAELPEGAAGAGAP